MDKMFKNFITLLTIFSFSGCAILPSKNCTDRDLLHSAPRDSFVKLVNTSKEGISTGSGVIIGHIKDTNTIILTVKHICDLESSSIVSLDIQENEYPTATVINSNNDDLCLIITKNKINKPAVKIAKNSLSVGDKILNIAAPLGIHAPDMVLMFTGYYDGKIKIPGEKFKLNVFSLPGRGGSSGSPVFNENWEVVGVISRGIITFENIMLGVDLLRIQKLVSLIEDPKFIQNLENPVSYKQLQD